MGPGGVPFVTSPELSAIAGLAGGPVGVRSTLPRDGHALNLDHHVGVGKACRNDSSAGGEIVLEYLATDFSHAGRVARVNQKHRHGHHVGELGASFPQPPFDVAEGLPALGVEIAASDLPLSSTFPVCPAIQMILPTPCVMTAGE